MMTEKELNHMLCLETLVKEQQKQIKQLEEYNEKILAKMDSFKDEVKQARQYKDVKDNRDIYVKQIADLQKALEKAKKKKESKEYILCSAIWYKEISLLKPEVLENRGFAPYNVDKGLVLCGWRHANIIYQLVALTGKPDHQQGESEQGFLTNKNRFVDRIEAADIAFKAKQIPEEVIRLFSENLY